MNTYTLIDINNLSLITVPAKLFVGKDMVVQTYAQHFLQHVFCKQNHETLEDLSDCFCVSCRMIKNRQHASLMWVTPEKDYTVAHIDEIIENARFVLDEQTRFFFVLDKAHTLTTAAANRLLKLLEEPPAGYHFLLLANNKNVLLPTIISRSYVITLSQEADKEYNHPLVAFFSDFKNQEDTNTFEQIIKKNTPTESESVELLNTLIEYFIREYSRTITQEHKQDGEEAVRPERSPFGAKSNGNEREILTTYLQKILKYLHTLLKKPPQAGSSELFWRMMFLTFPKRNRS